MLETIFLWMSAAMSAVVRLGHVRSGGVPLSLVLFGAGWVLGAAHPDGAWRRGLVLGLSVPVAHAVATLAHVSMPYASPSFAIACIALVPASLGTYAGVSARRAWGEAPAGAESRGGPL